MRGALLGTAIALVAAPAAGADVYWANKYQDAIAHAGSAGTGLDLQFIPLAPQSHPVGIAIDGAHVYWTSYELPDAIGRANLDGTGAEPAFITGAADPVGLAVDGAHVYWTNARSGTIGRANLDGSCVDQSFITRAHRPYGLAVEGGHIYWTNLNTGQIGRANIDGTAVDQGFISGVPNPTSLAADSAHLYWVRNESNGATDGAVGRVRLDGTVSEPDFIPLSGQIPWGVGVNAGHLYWSNQRDRAVGRAGLADGASPEPAFIPSAGDGVYGVATAPGPATVAVRTDCTPAPDEQAAARDTIAPKVSALALSRRVFAAASRGPAIARVRAGTTIRYRLSESSRVRFTLRRRARGRLRPLKGSILAYGVRGLNRLRFRGRLRGHKLHPGRYRLTASATDGAGNRSAPALVRFRIRPSRRARRHP